MKNQGNRKYGLIGSNQNYVGFDDWTVEKVNDNDLGNVWAITQPKFLVRIWDNTFTNYDEMTLEEIAKAENCDISTIAESIEGAIKKIQKNFR